MSRSLPALRGLFKEALVIFAGVIVALAADDWRDELGQRAEAEVSLRVLLSDLRTDSAAVSRGQFAASRQARAATWLFESQAVSEPPRDSLNAALAAMEGYARVKFSRAGYEGLRGANRMGLVGSEDLRSAIASYYEVDQTSAANYAAIVYDRREEMLATLAPLVAFTNSPPAAPEVTLSVPWGAVGGTPGIFTQLRRYGASMGALAIELDELELTLVELIRRVRVELGETN